jgi:hypothetical protein
MSYVGTLWVAQLQTRSTNSHSGVYCGCRCGDWSGKTKLLLVILQRYGCQARIDTNFGDVYDLGDLTVKHVKTLKNDQ